MIRLVICIFGKVVKSYHGQLRYPRVDRRIFNLPGSLDRTFSVISFATRI